MDNGAERREGTIDGEEKSEILLPPGEGPVLRSVLMLVGRLTANGNFYSRETLERALEGYQERIATHQALGTFGFPDVSGPVHVEVQDVSHRVHALYIDEESERVVSEVVVLPTKAGDDVKRHLESGEVECTPIGYGNRNEETGEITNYKILAIALVPKAEPDKGDDDD